MVFEENDYFDVDKLISETEEEFANETVVEEVAEEVIEDPAPEPEAVEETVEEEIIEETPEDVVETPEETPSVDKVEEEVTPTVDPDLHKRNEAFKEMRLENEKLAEQAEFVKKLADSYGMTSEELQKRFSDDQAKKEAEALGMKPENYTRMRELEEKVKTLESSKQEEVFNIYADKFIAEKEMAPEAFTDLAVEATKMGFDLMNHPNLIEVAYKALNYDKAIEKGRQAQLAETKKRRETSTGKGGIGGSVVNEPVSYDKEIDNLLKEQGIID